MLGKQRRSEQSEQFTPMTLGYMGTVSSFPAIFLQGGNFVTSGLLAWPNNPFQQGVSSMRKEISLERANSLLY